MPRGCCVLTCLCLASCFAGLLLGQTAGKAATSADASAAAQQAIALVEQGRCKEALPVLKGVMSRLTDKQLRYHAGMAEARCAMALEQNDTAVQALLQLKREFPTDPEVLYIMVHYLSQVASRTSQELAAIAPNSSQAQRLEAEAFESQGKWDEAAGIYRGILEQNPQADGIHYRLGQVLLSKAGDTGPVEEAKAEFQKELQIDPRSAASEFVLGELARRAGQWSEASQHFARASSLDVGFAEAYLANGMSLAAGGKFAQALAPLKEYVRMVPEDPTGHYQLAIAYARTGNQEAAAKEMALQKQTAGTQAQRPGGTGPGR
ncbi:MAG TPA: tetratricopeptide repeat protein [Bryobacteraceae bacterium]|nr:tetratricopeptide repeat protein [Bryobacteraceae bacterium]